jgi:hypothetical protein
MKNQGNSKAIQFLTDLQQLPAVIKNVMVIYEVPQKLCLWLIYPAAKILSIGHRKKLIC